MELKLQALPDNQRSIAAVNPNIWRFTCDAIADPLFLHDAEFRVLLGNRAYFRAAGISEAQALGLPYWQVFPLGDGPLPGCQGALLRQGGHCREEVEVGERLFSSSSNPVTDEQGSYLYSLHIMHDITALRHVELALRESERWANLILDTSPDAMMLVDDLGQILRANVSAETMFAYGGGSMVGLKVELLMPERYRAKHRVHRADFAADLQVRLRGKSRHLRACRQSGEEFDVEMGLGPLLIGGRSFVVISALDITQQIQASADREAALAESKRLAQARSDFLTNMSHEIRTPLNGVLGLALVGQRESLGRQANSTFNGIIDCGQHLLAVVNDILDFSRIEAGKLTTTPLPYHLDRMIERAVTLNAQRARSKGLIFKVKKSPDLPTGCLGDEVRILQVIVNLLSNAVKFTDQGSVLLAIDRDAESLIFLITDTGIGMSEEQVGRIFNAFEQADGATTRRFGGSGLGLSISRSLVDLMGGEIKVSSILGAGSCFELRLPLREVNLPLTDPVLRECCPLRRLQGINVLVADDNEINRLVLESLLGDEGARLVSVEAGQLAVDRLIADGPGAWDIFLTDIQMPEMDGYETTRRIRELGIELPIVGVTAHAMPESRLKCLAAGMVDHVSKPIDLEHLVNVILRHVALDAQPPSAGSEALAGSSPNIASGTESLTTAEAPVVVIDWPAIEANFNGKVDFVTRLAASLLQSHHQTPNRLRLAAERGDLAELAFIAHSIKGVAGNLMAHGVYAIAKETDQTAREGRSDAAGVLASALAEEVEKLLDAAALRVGT